MDIHVNTKAIELLREEPLSGRVIGVRAQGADGNSFTVEARSGVVLATGGFAQNAGMRFLHDPRLGEDIPSTNQLGITGDGIVMAEDVGAKTVGMDYIQLLPYGCPDTGDFPGFITSSPYEVIFVNQQGERFVDEGARRDVMTNALLEQEDSLMYVISDS